VPLDHRYFGFLPFTDDVTTVSATAMSATAASFAMAGTPYQHLMRQIH
jgi:hypothetical protein